MKWFCCLLRVVFHFTAPVNNVQPVLNHPVHASSLAKTNKNTEKTRQQSNTQTLVLESKDCRRSLKGDNGAKTNSLSTKLGLMYWLWWYRTSLLGQGCQKSKLSIFKGLFFWKKHMSKHCIQFVIPLNIVKNQRPLHNFSENWPNHYAELTR